MANYDKCVFCGEDLRFFHSYGIRCGDISLPCCKDCADELAELSEVEQCRRALRLGLVEQPEKLQERIELCEQAEAHRPACLRCGTKLRFGGMQRLDNSPMRDSFFTDTYDVRPAYCESCGKIEFYHPNYVARSKFMAYLIRKDTGD